MWPSGIHSSWYPPAPVAVTATGSDTTSFFTRLGGGASAAYAPYPSAPSIPKKMSAEASLPYGVRVCTVEKVETDVAGSSHELDDSTIETMESYA
jgi:hypothetical protein